MRGVRAGSFHSAVEVLSRYICETIASMLERGATSVELKRSVYDDYNARLDAGMKSLLWEEERGGDSYFLNSQGSKESHWRPDRPRPNRCLRTGEEGG